MRTIFDYKIIHIPGLEILPEDGEIDEAAIQNILRERSRFYNRLGAEGWELIAEHQNNTSFSVIATFKLGGIVNAELPSSPPGEASLSAPAVSAEPGDRSYPILQPNASAPDSYHLVWER